MLQRVWRKWNPPNSVGMQPLWKTVWRFFRKLKTELPCDLAIPLLGLYLDKTIIQIDTCTPMFIAALFMIAKTWKKPKCPLTNGWIKNMWYIYSVDYDSAIKLNEMMSFETTWIDLGIIIPNEVRKRKNFYMISLICGI